MDNLWIYSQIIVTNIWNYHDLDYIYGLSIDNHDMNISIDNYGIITQAYRLDSMIIPYMPNALISSIKGLLSVPAADAQRSLDGMCWK